jgi:hypothetical protein
MARPAEKETSMKQSASPSETLLIINGLRGLMFQKMEPFEMKNNYERLAMKSYSYRKECTV